MIFFMPYSHYEAVKSTPGIRDVTYASWFGGVYKDPKNFFAQFAVDPESYLRMYPEIVLTPGQKTAFLEDRTGAIVGAGLAKKYGFNLGDRMVLQVGIPIYGTQDFTFTIRGIYTSTSSAIDEQSMMFHWKYADERASVKGQVGWFVSAIDNPDAAGRISEALDQKFSNSPYETKTETEKAFQSSFISMFGNLNLLLGSIALAVVITTLFVAGNTMAMSVRERTTEIAVMRTLGFPAHTVFGLIAGEAVLIAFVGGLVGAGLARIVVTPEHFAGGGFVPSFGVTTGRMLSGIALGAAIGVLAGLIPATLASRLKIVDALRRVA
jgi:putative ABC transport system permease protein